MEKPNRPWYQHLIDMFKRGQRKVSIGTKSSSNSPSGNTLIVQPPETLAPLKYTDYLDHLNPQNPETQLVQQQRIKIASDFLENLKKTQVPGKHLSKFPFRKLTTLSLFYSSYLEGHIGPGQFYKGTIGILKYEQNSLQADTFKTNDFALPNDLAQELNLELEKLNNMVNVRPDEAQKLWGRYSNYYNQFMFYERDISQSANQLVRAISKELFETYPEYISKGLPSCREVLEGYN